MEKLFKIFTINVNMPNFKIYIGREERWIWFLIYSGFLICEVGMKQLNWYSLEGKANNFNLFEVGTVDKSALTSKKTNGRCYNMYFSIIL